MSVLTQEQMMRVVMEIVETRGDEGATEEELIAAVGQVEDLAISAAMWECWDSGRTRVKDYADGEVRWSIRYGG